MSASITDVDALFRAVTVAARFISFDLRNFKQIGLSWIVPVLTINAAKQTLRVLSIGSRTIVAFHLF